MGYVLTLDLAALDEHGCILVKLKSSSGIFAIGDAIS
jgi:hypothetical protein